MQPPLYGVFVVERFQSGASFFVRPGAGFFAPTRSIAKPARAGGVKVGRRANLAAYSGFARPHLDSFEHDRPSFMGRADGAVPTASFSEIAMHSPEDSANLMSRREASWRRRSKTGLHAMTDTSSFVAIASTIAACAGIGAAVDFYLGKSGAQRINRRLEDWWLRLSYVKWRRFGQEEAQIAVERMDTLFGSFISLRRVKIVVVLIAVGCLATLIPYFCTQNEYLYEGFFSNPHTIALTAFIVISSAVAFSFSISVTRNISWFLAKCIPQGYFASLLEFLILVCLHMAMIAI
jgi:hypothetical protein